MDGPFGYDHHGHAVTASTPLSVPDAGNPKWPDGVREATPCSAGPRRLRLGIMRVFTLMILGDAVRFLWLAHSHPSNLTLFSACRRIKCVACPLFSIGNYRTCQQRSKKRVIFRNNKYPRGVCDVCEPQERVNEAPCAPFGKF